MTDGRFSGGSVGLVIGHVGTEAYLGGPIGLIENGDTIIVDINKGTLDCVELNDKKLAAKRKAEWQKAAKENNGTHPLVQPVDNRLLNRMRSTARPAIEGAGIED